MGLEDQLYVKRFYVVESCQEVIWLHNDFGDFNLKPISEKGYGPHTSELEAQIQIETLRNKNLKKGWKEWDKTLFNKGKQDLLIQYYVQEKFIPYSKKRKVRGT